MLIKRLLLLTILSLLIFANNALAQSETSIQGQQSSSPAITASVTAGGTVRFTSPGQAMQIRLEIYNATGGLVYDSGLRQGSILDWKITDATQVMTDGSYLCVVSVKDFQGKLRQRLGALSVQSGQVTLQHMRGDSLTADQSQTLAKNRQAQKIETPDNNDAITILSEGKTRSVTVTAHDGQDGQVTTTSGSLTFRTGNVFSAQEKEQMRITPDGRVGIGTDRPEATLDVAGTVRARGGIVFDDGTVLNSAAGVSKREVALAATGTTLNITGTGSANKLAKWTDANGTLGDSTITEVDGRIGIGTSSPSAKLVVRGDSLSNQGLPGFRFENSADPLGRNVRMQNYYPGIAYFAANAYLDTPPNGIRDWYLDNNGRGGAGMALNTEEWIPGIGNYLQLWATPNGVAAPSPNLVIWENGKVSLNKPLNPTTQTATGLLDIAGKGSSSSTASLAVANSNSASLLYVRDDGNVGIGTSAPTARLDVAGNIKLSGAGNGIIFSDGSVMTTAGAGGGSLSGNSIVTAINDPSTVGTISDARVSPNLARLNGANAWSGANVFGAGLSAGGALVTNVGNPVNAGDATNKAYVDANFVKFVPGAEQLSVGDANGTAPMINLRGGSTCCSGPGGHTPAWFKVFQNGSFVATGNLGIGVSPMQGKGYRTSWDSYKGAFRSGYADNEWDDANVGFFSWAGGSNSTAEGLYAFAFGDTNFARSTSSIAFGSGNEVKGAAGFSAGAGNRVCDTYGVAFGNKAQSGGPLINGKCDPDSFNIRGLAAVAIGYNVTADQDHTTAMGKFASNNGFSGTFIWSDGSATASADTFRNTANNEFAARATGGFRFRTNLTGTTGCNLPAGSGVFNCTSSRYTKENFMMVSGEDVLSRLRKIPVSTWNYISEGQQVRHMGPMAEDFYQAFALGTGNTSIGVQDLAGVSLAAVKALELRTAQLQQKTAEVDKLRTEVNELRSANASMEQRLAALEQNAQRNAQAQRKAQGRRR